MSEFRFDCVFYYVTDLDQAIQFYERAFGFQLASRDGVARFHVDGVLVELVPAKDGTVGSGQGNARLTLVVDDLDVAVAGLNDKGVRTSDVQVVSNGRLVTVHDPDGNKIVVWQYA
jgi:catechol 2,3-dioxygenase-like lactoylglutathione lyase family enzyme